MNAMHPNACVADVQSASIAYHTWKYRPLHRPADLCLAIEQTEQALRCSALAQFAWDEAWAEHCAREPGSWRALRHAYRLRGPASEAMRLANERQTAVMARYGIGFGWTILVEELAA